MRRRKRHVESLDLWISRRFFQWPNRLDANLYANHLAYLHLGYSCLREIINSNLTHGRGKYVASTVES